MDRLKVGIIFGGCSEEHSISVKSAQEVATNLDIEKYEQFYIGITASGAWKLCDGLDADWENGNCRPVILSPDRSVHGLLVLEQGQYEAIRLDAGLGRALVNAAEQWALQHGLQTVVVHSNVVRPESRPFYEGIGYQRTKTSHTYHKEV